MEDTSMAVPWHLAVYTPSMGIDATASALMFEHTRLTIRAIAVLYQTMRDQRLGLEPLGLADRNQTEEVQNTVVNELLAQVEHWRPKIMYIATMVREYTYPQIVIQTTRLLGREGHDPEGLLVDHILLAYRYATAMFLERHENASRLAEDLYGENAGQIVEILSNITLSPGHDRFSNLWKTHLDCTAAYIDAARTGDDEQFDIYASKCLRSSVLVGAALDESLGHVTYLTREANSSIAAEEKKGIAEKEEKEEVIEKPSAKDASGEYW
jgi:hypothetical protein